MSEYTAEIFNWRLSGNYIEGLVFKDELKRFPDNSWIITSSLKEGQEELKQGDIVETKNNKYLLGYPHE